MNASDAGGTSLTGHKWSQKLGGLKLDGVIQKMKYPYLLVHGEGDQQARRSSTRKT